MHPKKLTYAGLAFSVIAAFAGSTAYAQENNPERNAYFGEQHIHTSWSVDAWLFGNHLTGPKEALEYAQGATIKHPLGYEISIETPLDWMGVTDHSEYVGITKMANTPGSPVSKLPEAQPLILKDPNNQADVQKVFLYLVSLVSKPPVKAFMNPKITGSIWKENVEIADNENKPGKFTTFCAYEYTSQYNLRNLHRNVYFRDCAKVPEAPFSSLDSWHPEDLWKWMDKQREMGNELLAISHNANLSDGWMYPTDLDSLGRPIDAAWAASRDRNERLIEIKQIKGQSETHPLLSPNDEFANFEVMSFLIGQPEDNGRIPSIIGSYARQALKDGLSMQDSRGYNPYKFGIVSGSDSHNSGAPYRQTNFYGGHGINDGTIETRMSGQFFAGIDVRKENPAGLSGIWAEENTRSSLWDAMYRKETFGTSGPRVKIRLFGGWNYDSALLDKKDWVKSAYAGGVPMGGDLPPAKSDAPNFVVWAMKDPTSGNLDRIEIVKGWTKNGQSFEKIYDVAWSDERVADKWTGRISPVKSTLDIDKATYSNSVGAVELKTVWTDPDFDPSQHAFYYARALEIPTPRWSTIQARQIGIAPPDTVPATVQERAWSSPIWYTPSGDARKAANPGMTVADLTSKGAKELNDAEVKDLLVGKAIWLTNTVTGEFYKSHFDKTGNTALLYAGQHGDFPGATGNVGRNAYTVEATPYSIKDGKVVTMVGNVPFETAFYKLGEKYYGARSNEFGYANYEILSKGPGHLLTLEKGDYMKKNQADFLHSTTEVK
jgi:Protein of unknown function (DUF3604)